VSIGSIIGMIAAAGLLVYLMYALLKPERLDLLP
jgi:K+-transporting ATPase KdpF subunit